MSLCMESDTLTLGVVLPVSEQKSDVELIREVWAAWNGSGVDEARRFLHPDIEWTDPKQLPDETTHVGLEAVTDTRREWDGSVIRLSFDIEEIIPLGDDYLVCSKASGIGASGTPIPPHDWFHIVSLEDGLIRRMRTFLDRDAALVAAGLSK